MIEIKNYPPQAPGDIVLSETGLELLKAHARPRGSASRGDLESVAHVRKRLQTIGQTLGATVFALVDLSTGTEAMQVVGHLAEQYRATLDRESESERALSQSLGAGLYLGVMDMLTIPRAERIRE